MLTGPVFAAAAVLVVAGMAKIRRPVGTTAALRNAGIGVGDTAGDVVVRLLGVAELLLGVLVIVRAPVAALAALALVYVGFAVFSLRLLTRREANASCGCFGAAQSPVHPIHVVINLVVAATVAAAAVRWHPDPLADVPIAVLIGSCLLAATTIGALTLLPALLIESAKVLTTDRT